MPAITVNSFSGERPRLDKRHLPNESAQTAQGCHFYNGNLSPLNKPLLTSDSVLFNAKTIFRYLNEHWFSWPVVVDAIKSPIASDPWERVYFTGDGYPKVTNNAIFNGSAMPANSYRLGVQAPEIQIICTVNESVTDELDPNDDETRYYTHTFVTEQGEEGPPGEASLAVEILYPDELDTSVTLSFSPPNVNLSNITHRRIYRTATGGGVADYLLVAEIPISDSEFIDNIQGNLLGIALESYDYEMPPEDLIGLTSMANGIVAGFTGNTVAFSESFLPYAWPTGYQLTTEHDIVAIVAIGNSLAVLTEGYPWLFSGVTPESISGQKLESNQSCVSKRSAVIVNGSLIYASPDGLVALTGSGVQPITNSIITREQWQGLQPDTIEAYYQEGRYLAFYGVALNKCFIFDPETGDFRFFDATAYCGYNELLTDSLFIAEGGGVSEWESSAEPMSYTWVSKEFTTQDIGFSCVRIRGDDLNLCGFTLFAGDDVVLEIPIGELPDYAFRLPVIRSRKWSFQLTGTSDIENVTIATSMGEII